MNASSVRSWLTDNFGWLVIVIALIFGATYAYEVHGEHARASCQSSYNAAFAAQLTERSKLSTETSDAQTHLLQQIGAALAQPATTDPKVQAQRVTDFFKLFTDFTANTSQIAADRAATPLPPIPSCN